MPRGSVTIYQIRCEISCQMLSVESLLHECATKRFVVPKLLIT